MTPTCVQPLRMNYEGADKVIALLDAYDDQAKLLRDAREALIQARGALRLDVMVDDDGHAFGTTEVALEAIDTVLSRLAAAIPTAMTERTTEVGE